MSGDGFLFKKTVIRQRSCYLLWRSLSFLFAFFILLLESACLSYVKLIVSSSFRSYSRGLPGGGVALFQPLF